MIPRLLTTDSSFTVAGAALSDAASCTVTEIRNDAYTLQMAYPVKGKNYDLLALRAIIMVKPNPTDDPQPFRITKITAPSNGLVTISANHICYDLSGYVCEPFTAGSAAAAMQALVNSSVPSNPFTLSTDIATSADMNVILPTSVRALMGGVAGSVIDTYGGEWEYDKRTCYLRAARGSNRGVKIRYGKNLQTLEQEQNCDAVYTAVYPFWKNDEGELVTLTEKTVACPGTYDYTRILALDLSDKFEEKPSETQLRNAASSYITDNDVGIPVVSLKVSFVQLEQTTDYADKALLERVSLCDTVTVEFPDMGVNATAKVIKTVYDPLREKYDSVEIGSYRSNIANTIASVSRRVKALETTPPSPYREAVDRATQLITGNLGGYVLMHDSNGDGEPDEILVMDTDDINTAMKVWRWNKNGLGYSPTGYNGNFGLAMTADGEIVADFIKAGTLDASQANVTNLNASNITSGTINGARVNVKGSLTWFSQSNQKTINVMNEIINMMNDMTQLWRLNETGLFLSSDTAVIGGTDTAMNTSLHNLTKSSFNEIAAGVTLQFKPAVPSVYLIVSLSGQPGAYIFGAGREVTLGIEGILTTLVSASTLQVTFSSDYVKIKNIGSYANRVAIIRLY